jgi:ATP dependent DNA ligase domain
MAIRIKRIPAGFVIPAQPALASKPPTGADWVHEIKHDGYRMIVRRDRPAVRLYSRNAYDWTARLSAIAAAAERIKAKSFTIDGEAVVLGPDGLSRFEELSRRSAARTAILYAFDLIEHDGEICAIARSSSARLHWRDYCALPRQASCLTNTSRRTALSSSSMPAGLAPRASCRRRSIAPTGPVHAVSGSRSAIRPASRCSGSGARCGIAEAQAVCADDDPPQGQNHLADLKRRWPHHVALPQPAP